MIGERLCSHRLEACATAFVIGFASWLLILGFVLPVSAQEVLEYTHEDAVILYDEIRTNDETIIMKLAPGLYDMEVQLRFQDSSPIIEGSGSGLGPDATILDFWTYSSTEEDARALSVRGPLTMRNLTVKDQEHA